MKTANLWFSLIPLLLLSACSQRTGYEIFRQMNYQEYLKNSPRLAEDCQFAPDFDKYQQERELRYPRAQKPD